MISGFEAARQARVLVAGFEPAIDGSLQTSGQIRYSNAPCGGEGGGSQGLIILRCVKCFLSDCITGAPCLPKVPAT
ncbi:hypothetical protein PoB_007282500 [Plakobranchus ocellatus]|uniref:Uncharacterized protein n=1 Tax=Plakobranchus ocellatus TaxID=259542 RepID=A0AAV4DQI9_9GAST|nr:hypothetical protein PoB_007282500 [Plakobranchus ocellatus]